MKIWRKFKKVMRKSILSEEILYKEIKFGKKILIIG